MKTLVMVRGVEKVAANLQKLVDEINRPVIEAVTDAAMMLEREAKINQTPHVDTGRLRASIVSEKKDDFEIHVGAAKVAPVSGARFEAGSSVEYALKHEYRYPFMQPAIETVRQKYPDLIKENVKAEIR
jgi:hypothetical protein